MRLLELALIVFVGLCNGAIFTDDQVKDIREFVETVLRCHDIPGASIAVVKGNESWTLPLGFADVAAQRGVTEETLFGIGSISKSFTATLISLLIDESEGKITFDTPVSKILGDEYEFPDKPRTKRITIKDVLSHRTGLSSLNLAVMFGGPYGISREDFTKQVSSLPVVKPLRDEWFYSNFMFMLAGHLVEKVWGESWEDNLKSKLLDKIGMTNTEAMTDVEELVGERYARPYVYLKGVVREADPRAFMNSQLTPAGYLATSAVDRVKFMRFFLNKGKLEDGTQLIQESTIADMWEPVIPISKFFRPFFHKESPQWPVADVSMGYGLGWFVNVYRGHRYVYHPGGLHSYTSVMQIYPGLDLGLFMAINGPTATTSSQPMSSVMSALYYITDVLIGETPWIDNQQACSFPKPWFDIAALIPPPTERMPVKAESPLVKYTGTYFNPLIGILVVSLDSSSNELKVEMNGFYGVLVPEKGGLFGIEAKGHFEFVTWPEKDNPLYLYKAKFIRGDDSYEAVEIVSNPPLEPPLKFQGQSKEDMEKIRDEL